MYKVIVVDDEVLVRNAITKKLSWESMGFELAGSFEHGAKAKEYLEGHEVDVVLTDICMPYMDGMELSKYIHEHMPHVHVIIFSGFDEFEYAKKAIQYRVMEYLLKPVTASDLSGVLQKTKEKLDVEKKEKLKKSTLSKVVNKNKTYLQSRALYKLISGTESFGESIKELAETDIVLAGKQFSAAWLNLGFGKGKDREESGQNHLYQFIIYNMASEIVVEQNMGYVGLGHKNHIFILFQTETEDEQTAEQEMINCLERIQKTIQENTNIAVSMTLGSVVDQPERLVESYEIARDDLSYIYLYGNGHIFKGTHIRETGNHEIEDSKRYVDALCMAVQLNDEESVSDTLKSLKQRIRDCGVERRKAVICLELCMKALYHLGEKNQINLEEIEGEARMMYRMEQAECLDSAVEVLAELAREAGKLFDNISGNEQGKLVIKAMEDIHANYWDANLKLTNICRKYGFSISRFSAAFKERYNETFMEALIRVRMENAKRLLQTTKLKNYEIAERVGFSDPHYFSIAFKKATGKTPTEWGRNYGTDEKKA